MLKNAFVEYGCSKEGDEKGQSKTRPARIGEQCRITKITP